MTVIYLAERLGPKIGQRICFPVTDYNTPGMGTIGRVSNKISAVGRDRRSRLSLC